MKRRFLSMLLLIVAAQLKAGHGDWQMRARYVMSVDFFAGRHQYRASQTVVLFNDSPDTLTDLYFHLYPNAFQPGSDMDIRSRTIEDPDPRVGSRINALKPDETGFIRPEKISVNRKGHAFEIDGTILRIRLASPVFPGDSCQVSMRYEAQVPVQIRRSGRFNREGVDYSMAQWYPKLCGYDGHGWHTDPYIGREFYGPWSDYDVTIRIDPKYVVAATGYLQEERGGRSSRKWKSWRFVAPRVHDFVWAADPDYVKQTRVLPDGRKLFFYHIPHPRFDSVWNQLPAIMHKALDFIEPRYGPYPYQSYSFIQGGDGGMEYPMATLIMGNRPLNSLVGLCLHEWMHTWFQMMLATNESLYPWMDEGFTSFAEAEVKNHIDSLGLIPGVSPVADPMRATMEEFVKFSRTGKEEPLCTHADHYQTNRAYGVGSYGKGSICLSELRYIMGDRAFRRGMLYYYWSWRFRHPDPDDFFRVMEKASGLDLDWFQQYWVHSTRAMDYSVDSVIGTSRGTKIILRRSGSFPMPVDLVVRSAGVDRRYTIPLDLMRGSKVETGLNVLPVWHWVNPVYSFELELPLKDIRQVEIDPGYQMPDTERIDNTWIGQE